MEEIYLLLGSNLGNRYEFLEKAREHITEEIGPIIKSSSVYETASWGKTDQPDFINQVIYLNTTLNPDQLLDCILNIEIMLGRKRIERWGSRTIDIDILFYGNEIINKENLTIPHPGLHERAFTLIPLAEIAPLYMHPTLKKSIKDLCNNITDRLSVRKYV